MNTRHLWIVLLLFCASALAALDSEARPQLKLVPAPKEVQLRDGGFQVGPRTRILVQLGHQSEDRIAAETLPEEVAAHPRWNPTIHAINAPRHPTYAAILLTRL